MKPPGPYAVSTTRRRDGLFACFLKESGIEHSAPPSVAKALRAAFDRAIARALSLRVRQLTAVGQN